MTPALPYIGIFLFACLIEIGWVLAVRAVDAKAVTALVLISMGMQAVSYLSTIVLVSNSLTMLTGVMGAGFGALLGLRVPATLFQKSDPKP